MISIQKLTKTYAGRVHALQGIDLEIGSGMFGLVGPNGAGKTTLMRVLSCLIRPSSGNVSVFGNDVTSAKGKAAIKANLGYLPQELGLYPDLTAREFLDYIAILKGMTDKKVRSASVEECLETVHLKDEMDQRLKTFSGGMKRRIGIAQALLGHPRLLIVDEPTAGLDPEERVHLRNTLTNLAGSSIVILSTHIIEDVNQSCNDLAVIHRGKVIFRETPRKLIEMARGNVWNIVTGGGRPDSGLIIISTLQLADGIQFRVLGQPSPQLNPQPAEPNLEDGYLWLMHSQ